MYIYTYTAGTRAPEVAFSVQLGINTYAAADPVVFNSVIANIGSDYSTSTGKFTCTRGGVYVFAATLTATSNSFVNGFINKNGATQLYIYNYVDPSTPSHNPSASGQVVIRLTAGDEVWVGSYQPIRYNYSAFSGFLLYEM
jgi:hypothetical protein